MDSELKVLQQVVVQEADFFFGIEEDLTSERALLAHMFSTLSCVSYTESEIRHVNSFLAEIKRNTDLQGKLGFSAINATPIQLSSVFKLQSKNFGYDFVLVKSENGKNWLGQVKTQVTLYRSNLDANQYSTLGAFTTLSKALRKVAALYVEAANLHLA